jgi:hypothetical protein
MGRRKGPSCCRKDRRKDPSCWKTERESPSWKNQMGNWKSRRGPNWRDLQGPSLKNWKVRS